MTVTRCVLALTLALGSVAAAQQPPPTPPQLPAAGRQLVPVDRIVGMVGDTAITYSQLQERIIQVQQQGGVKLPDSSDVAGWHAFELQTLNTMIDEEVLLAKAAVEKIDVPDVDLNRAVDDNVKRVRAGFTSEDTYKAELLKAGLGTPEEYRRFLMDQFRRTELQQRLLRKMQEDGRLVPVNVTEQEVQEAFAKAKAAGLFQHRPSTVTWKQIVINPRPTEKAKAKAKAKADSLLAEIKAGADFERVAKRESMDPGSKELGGDLGWHRRGDGLVPDFERWLFVLSPGQLSPVIETVFGYHIIRVDRVNGPEVKSRHILISPVIDVADVARAQLEADSVRTLWLAGVPFDTLAQKYHDFASREETGVLDPYPRDSLPVEYATAFSGKKAGDIFVFPIPVSGHPNVPKYVVARIETADPGGEYTLADMRERVRAQLVDERSDRRFIDGLRKLTYISIRLDTLPPKTPAAKPGTP